MTMTRRLVPLALTLALASACSGNADAQPEEPEDFRSAAARHCTEVINDHLDFTRPEPGVEVLMAMRSDEEPSGDQLQTWGSEFEEIAEWRNSLRADLDELSSDDPTEQQEWQQIVASDDDDTAFVRERAALLGSQDWERIEAEFEPASGPIIQRQVAISALGLEGTDCEWVRFPVVTLESPEFIREVTSTCTEIDVRRAGSDFAADADSSVVLLGEIAKNGPPEEIPEETTEALDRLHQEWVQTLEDLESVDADGLQSPEAWAETLAVAQERVEVFEARSVAVESGDEDAITEAFSLSRLEHPAPEWAALGLTNRSCAGLRF